MKFVFVDTFFARRPLERFAVRMVASIYVLSWLALSGAQRVRGRA